MALIWNTSVLFKTPLSCMSWASLSTNRANWNTPWLSRGIFYWEGQVVWVTEKSSVPQGYTPPYTWILAPKAWWLGSGFSILGAWAVSNGNLAWWKNGEVTMNGSGTISDANLGLILSAVATLSGIGGLSSDVAWALQASATLAGQWDFTASLWALAWAVATLTWSWAIIWGITALGHMSADIYVNQSTASVEEIAAAVWNALAAEYNTSGTMWEAAQAWGWGWGGWLTPTQDANLTKASKALTLPQFIALQNP